MGIDVINRRVSYSWGGWEHLFKVGLQYGWKPLGTLRPGDFDGDWGGGYFSNDFQIVAEEDAKNWSGAIWKAIEAMKPAGSPPKTTGHTYNCAPWEKDNVWPEISWLEEFARVAAEGEMVLC